MTAPLDYRYPSTYRSVWQPWRDFLDSQSVHSFRHFYARICCAESPFWRLIVWDLSMIVDNSMTRCLVEDYKIYPAWMRELRKRRISGPLSDEMIWRFHAECRDKCAGRRLFFTKNGYVGLGPTEMQPGDSIHILAGGAYPFVLRPVTNATR